MTKFFATVLAIASTVTSGFGEWHFTWETGFLFDSNISRSDKQRDRLEDWAWKSIVGAGYSAQLSRDLRLNLSAELNHLRWGRFEALNELGPRADVSLRHRFGLGPLAPWVLVQERFGYEDFRENGRSGWDQEFAVRAGKALTEHVAVELDYSVQHYSANAHVFDQFSQGGSIRLVLDPSTYLQIAVGYAYRYGDVISHAVPPRPDIVGVASAFEPVKTFESPYVAYRFNATTQTFFVAASIALGKYVGVEASYQRLYTSHQGLDYVNDLVEAKVSIVY